MFVFDIASHASPVPLWYAASRSSRPTQPGTSTRTPEARAYRIADAFAELARLGVLRNGDKLPSERKLAEMLDVSRDAVRVALDVLQQRRMLKKRHGARSELCGLGLLEADAPPLPAVSYLGLESAIDALCDAPLAPKAARIDDLIRIATMRAREAGDAEAVAICARLEAAHDLRRLEAE